MRGRLGSLRGAAGRRAVLAISIMTHRIPVRCRVDPITPDSAPLNRAATVLRQGYLVAYPTDTLYGIAADPRVPEAISRLFEIKGRGLDVAIPLIAADGEQVSLIADLSALGRRLADRFWPGPLTMVFDARAELSRQLTAGKGTVAVRVPDHAVARGLALALGHPITATSANRSGEPPAAAADDIGEGLGGGLAMVLDTHSAARPGGLASTIVDVRGETPVLLREGRVAWDRVLQSCA